MKTLKFKTNIKCSGCLNKVTPHLNTAKGIVKWTVDIFNREKILTVEAENITASEVREAVKKAGFEAEEIQ
jgi:copper chaperone